MQLHEETKANQTKVADMVIAYKALASGLSLGLWIECMQDLWPNAEGAVNLLTHRLVALNCYFPKGI